MRGFLVGISLSIAFMAGSFFAQHAVPEANAQGRMVQKRLQQWEFACFKNDFQGWRPDPVLSSQINQQTKKGWMLSYHEGATQEYLCFKPKPRTLSRSSSPQPGSPGMGVMPGAMPVPGGTSGPSPGAYPIP